MTVELPDHVKAKIGGFREKKIDPLKEPVSWMLTIDPFKPEPGVTNDSYVLPGVLTGFAFMFMGFSMTTKGYRYRDMYPVGQVPITGQVYRILGFGAALFGSIQFARMITHGAYFAEMNRAAGGGGGH